MSASSSDIALSPSRTHSPAPSASVAGSAPVHGHEHRHEREHEHEHLALSFADVLPPAYTRSAAPPPYAELEEDLNAEPFTVARLLFRYGFMFPLFWFIGALILTLPLHAPASWEETKTEEERNILLKSLREIEVKWSRRCLYASLVFFVVLAAVMATVVLVTRG